jgi:predicted RNA-binding protein with PUA-like domain
MKISNTKKNYWLMKSEPESWSWDQQKKKKTEHWDGVRNYQAANYMKQMKIGDECLFYHSVSEKAIKGIVKVSREYYPDPSDKKGIFGMVDVTYVKNLKEVYLSEIKADPFFDNFPLVKQSRLSVMPVLLREWKKLIKMSEKNERI